jgi:hypothetical protein
VHARSRPTPQTLSVLLHRLATLLRLFSISISLISILHDMY